VEDGEQAKRWTSLERAFDALLAARCGRDTLIVALGGGVIGDLAGFAAAIYQRGVALLQVPTTLLAQVDSSVGGKTAINHVQGKNMLGAFHQPRAVITDVATLDTLPERELRAGLAEVIKHALALDLRFVEWLEKNIDELLARERSALVYAVRRCCELKAGVVAADERESGVRSLLNFGHTFGHALEAATGFSDRLFHGEGVAIGMVLAFRDITDSLRIQEERANANKLASLGLLAGGIAHDFNNILGGILGYAEMLVEGLAPGSAQKRYAQNVLTAATRAGALVDQILAYSRSQRGKRAPVDLGRVVHRAGDLLAQQFPVALPQPVDRDLDRAGRRAEFGGDLFIHEPACYERHHLLLTWRQSFKFRTQAGNRLLALMPNPVALNRNLNRI